MRNGLILLVTLLACSIASFGQQTDQQPCPSIEVSGPAGIPGDLKRVPFTLTMGSEASLYELSYTWTISSGEIVSGQGTRSVEVSYKDPGTSMTVSVEVVGLPPSCKNTDSDTMAICILPTAIKLDEFKIPFSDLEKRLDDIIVAINNQPSAALYGIVYPAARRSSVDGRKKQKELIKRLIKKLGARDRLDVNSAPELAKEKDGLIVIWLVPAGADRPQP